MDQAKHPYPSRPIRVIHLSGSDREIGRRHVELLKAEAGQSMPVFYHRMWRQFLEMNPKDPMARAAMKVGKWLVDPLLVRRLHRGIPDWLQERALGVSEVGGQVFDGFSTAMVLPDIMNLLQAFFLKVRPNLAIDVSAPRIGCTSFVAQTKSGLLHGRNLDFPGVGYWDRLPLVQMIAPKDGLKSIGFSTTGVVVNGITGINEAQISVSLHQHYCLSTSLRGKLPFAIGEEILRYASTLDDALRILKNTKVSSSWAFVVTDGKSQEGFIFECQPKAFAVRRLHREKVLAHSNVFQSLECGREEYATTARMNWDNYWRRRRLHDLVSAAGDDLTPAQAAQMMSDHYDGFWNEEKPINRTISQVYNIQSLVLDPVNMVAYLAEGDCPVHLRRYRKINLGDVFAGKEGLTDEYLPGYAFKNEKIRAAKESYILSFVAAFDNDFTTALERVTKCIDHHFTPEAGLVYSVFCLKNGEFEKAKTMLERGKQWIEAKPGHEKAFPPEYFETCVYLARANDLLGKRKEAEAVYQTVAGDHRLQDANIRRIAKKALPYAKERLDRILTPYSSYIPFE